MRFFTVCYILLLEFHTLANANLPAVQIPLSCCPLKAEARSKSRRHDLTGTSGQPVNVINLFFVYL